MRRRTRSIAVSAGLGVAVLLFVAWSVDDYVQGRRALRKARELRTSVDAYTAAQRDSLNYPVQALHMCLVLVTLLGSAYVVVWACFGIFSAITGQAVQW